jgi:hypothetical protein
LKTRPLLELAVLLIFLALFTLAWGIIAGHQAGGGAPYTQPITLISAARLLRFATLAAMRENFVWTMAPWFLAGSLLAFGAIIATLHRPSSRLRAVVFGLQWLVVWSGWLGLYALPFDVVAFLTSRQDAEWLAEAWAPIEMAGCWLIASAFLCLGEIKALQGTAPRVISP